MSARRTARRGRRGADGRGGGRGGRPCSTCPTRRAAATTGHRHADDTAEITKETLVDRENHDGTLGHGDTTYRRGARKRHGDLAPRGRRDHRPRQGRLPDRQRAGGAALRLAARLPDAVVRGGGRRRRRSSRRTCGRSATAASPSTTSTPRPPPTRSKTGRTTSGSSETGRVETEPDRVRAGRGPDRLARRAEAGAVVQPGTELARYTGTAWWPPSSWTWTRPAAGQEGRRRRRSTLPDGKSAPGRSPGSTRPCSEGQGDAAGHHPDRGDGRASPARRRRAWTTAAVTVAFTAAQRPGRAHRAGGGAARARRGRLRRAGRRRHRPRRSSRWRPACSPTARSRSPATGLQPRHEGRGCRHERA